MDWVHVLTIVAANAGLFFWSRTESRSDFRMMMEMMAEMKNEMKDFHGRLCAIEERNRK